MALQQIPQASAGGAAFPGAGSLVASAYTTNLYYKTTLPAGTYFFYGIAEGSATHTISSVGESQQGYRGSTPSTDARFNMAAYNEFQTNSVPSGTPAVFKLSTTREVMFSAGFKFQGSHSSFRDFTMSNSPNHGWSNTKMVDNCISDFVPIVGYNRDGQGWRFAHVGLTGGKRGNRQVNYTSYALTTTTGEFPSIHAEFGGTFFVGYGTGSTANKFYRSTDSSSWSNISPSGLNNSVTNVQWSGTTLSAPNCNFVVTSDSSTNGNNLASSTDGITWTTRQSGHAQPMYALAYSSTLDRWVVGGGAGAISTSNDGITWTPRTSTQSTAGWSRCAWNATAGRFLLWHGATATTTDQNNAAYSTDGITWTATRIAPAEYVQPPAGISATNQNNYLGGQTWYIDKLLVIDGVFHAWSSLDNLILVSTDGISWSYAKTNDMNAQLGSWNYSSNYGHVLTVPRRNYDDYNGNTLWYAQPATYQIYSSTIV